MLTFRQMEKAAKIAELIQQYETMIDQIDSGLTASKIDIMPGVKDPDPHRIERQLIQKEAALTKLPQLRLLREAYLPRVQETIEEATAGKKPSARIKLQMIMKMRYEQGRSWEEIQYIAQIQEPQKKVLKALGGKT